MIEEIKISQENYSYLNRDSSDIFINKNQSKEDNQNKSKVINVKNNDKLSITGKELSDAEEREVKALKEIDARVKAHEQAHIAAGGSLVRGGASFTYKKGPDGRDYAVAGEVKIDASPDPNNPEATIRKMQQVKRAALAPVDPSPQDRKVAIEATQIENQAFMELAQQRKNLDKYANNPSFNNSYSTPPIKSLKNSLSKKLNILI
jgi:hypothetical protein